MTTVCEVGALALTTRTLMVALCILGGSGARLAGLCQKRTSFSGPLGDRVVWSDLATPWLAKDDALYADLFARLPDHVWLS